VESVILLSKTSVAQCHYLEHFEQKS